MLRRRNIKLLLAVPIVWIFVMVFMSFGNNTATDSQSLSQLLREKEKIRILEDQNKQLANLAQAEKEKAEKVIINQKVEEKPAEEVKHEDHDHPEEERKKAAEQNKKGPIQINAPKDNNPNAPGKKEHV
jgi:hypothetical protein